MPAITQIQCLYFPILSRVDALGEGMPSITLIQCLFHQSCLVYTGCPGKGDASYVLRYIAVSISPGHILFGLNRVEALGEGMTAMYSDTMSLFPQVLSCLVQTG